LKFVESWEVLKWLVSAVTLAAMSCSTVCWFGGLSSSSRAAAVAAVAAVVVALAWMACSAAAVSASSFF